MKPRVRSVVQRRFARRSCFGSPDVPAMMGEMMVATTMLIATIVVKNGCFSSKCRTHAYIYIVYTYTHTHIYIYIYTHTYKHNIYIYNVYTYIDSTYVTTLLKATVGHLGHTKRGVSHIRRILESISSLRRLIPSSRTGGVELGTQWLTSEVLECYEYIGKTTRLPTS